MGALTGWVSLLIKRKWLRGVGRIVPPARALCRSRIISTGNLPGNSWRGWHATSSFMSWLSSVLVEPGRALVYLIDVLNHVGGDLQACVCNLLRMAVFQRLTKLGLFKWDPLTLIWYKPISGFSRRATRIRRELCSSHASGGCHTNSAAAWDMKWWRSTWQS
jgi:hypothetical protein